MVKCFLLSNHFILLLFLGLLSNVSSQIVPVCVEPHAQYAPAIYGNRLLYFDDRTGDNEIYLYEISTGSETNITNSYGNQQNPDIWNEWVVWEDDRAGNWDIYLKNLLTGITTQVTSDTSDETNPKIWGEKIVWETNQNIHDIYLYNRISGVTVPISTLPTNEQFPDIWQDLIVWQDHRNGEDDIFMYDLQAGEEQGICTEGGNQRLPTISNNRIAWMDDRWGNWDVYLYIIPWELEWALTREEIDQFIFPPADQCYPQLQGDLLVFDDERGGYLLEDIYLFEISYGFSGNLMPICTDNSRQTFPTVFDDAVAWVDNRNGNNDIYMWQRPPGADLSITIYDDPDPVEVDDYLTYQLHLTNNGPLPATGVVVSDTLPPGVEFFSATSSQGNCVVSGNIITVSIGNMNVTGHAGITIIVHPLGAGYVNNRAGVTGSENDEIPGNNNYTCTTAVSEMPKHRLASGWNPAMAIDHHGNYHISVTRHGAGGTVVSGPTYTLYDKDDIVYISNESGSQKLKRVFDGYSWFNINIINYPVYFKEAYSSDIAVDEAGDIHIVYAVYNAEYENPGPGIVWVNYEIQYRKRENGIWLQPEILQENIPNCAGLSIGIDPYQMVHISYKPGSGSISGAGLIHITNATGNWISEEIVPNSLGLPGMAVDESGYVHFSLYPPIKYITNAPDGIWHPAEIVDSSWTGGQMEFLYTDIVVDGSGNPHLSYSGGSTGIHMEDTRYATKRNGKWFTSLIDTGGYQSYTNKIAVDPDTNVHVLYMHNPTWELRYANNTPGSWVIETIDPNPSGWWSPNNTLNIESDPSRNIHLCYGPGWPTDEKIIYLQKHFSEDTDFDGVTNQEESGTSGNDPGYDGNGDGLADSQQRNVSSFHTWDGDNYITIESSDTTALSNVRTTVKPSPGDPGAPGDQYCPYGFFRFTLMGINAGQPSDVNLYLHGGPTIETYYKYGATPDSTIDHWYQFNYLPPTGAVMHGDTVTLHLWDGLRGDDDLSGNGIIVEPGGPTLFVPSGLQQPDGQIPAEFALQQNYPNPFNPSTTIRYSLPRMSDVEITVFNILGQKVFQYNIKNQAAGTYNLIWDGLNNRKHAVATGMYIYRLKAGNFVSIKKMLLLR